MRQHGGTFILRIEDTDEARNRPEWTDGIIAALDWLGMAPDEGPYFQSAQEETHAGRHRGALGERRALRLRVHPRGDRRADQGRGRRPATRPRATTGTAATSGLPRGEGRALRFRTPDEGVVRVDDLVRGEVEFPLRALEDFICVKGNGKPLFVLANAVDDRTMAITHVIRGEDQLPTTPRQILLWGALNAAEGTDLALPAYAHLPLLVNEQGKKLSKRRDPVAVEMYREQGYLPAAFRNYLALLGWSPGDEEIVPVEELIERFRLEDVQRSPAFFDIEEADAHQRRVHPRAGGGRVRRGGAAVGRPGAGGVGAGRVARPRHRRAGDRAPALAAGALRRRRPSPRWPR